jgi:hypothetical protein
VGYKKMMHIDFEDLHDVTGWSTEEFAGCVADDQAEKQLFGAYLHVLKSRVDDVWWGKNRGRT